MHQFVATLFALLAAFCHHTSLTARPVEAAELPAITSQAPDDQTSPAMILPDRYQLARYTSNDNVYAESTCVSCRRTDGSSNDR